MHCTSLQRVCLSRMVDAEPQRRTWHQVKQAHGSSRCLNTLVRGGHVAPRCVKQEGGLTCVSDLALRRGPNPPFLALSAHFLHRVCGA